MTVNSYLRRLSAAAVVSPSEKESVSRSISTLQAKLNHYFNSELAEHMVFGSYTRGTILPRSMDVNSDIDYMIVFNESNYKPQTYLNKLRKFVEFYYSRSEISQSNPTIVLALNHIKFELVPAINGFWTGLKIPAKRADLNDWISTEPNDINQILTQTNQSNNNLIKPMIRLVKYWNANNNYPFASFELEKELAEREYFFVRQLSSCQLKDYFLNAIASLSLSWDAAQYKKNALNKAQSIVQEVETNLENGWEHSAESAIKKLLPELTSRKSRLGGLQR